MVLQEILLSVITISTILYIFVLHLKHVKKEKDLNIQIQDLNAELKTTQFQLKNSDELIAEKVLAKTNALEQELIERQKKDADLKIALKREEDANYLKNAFLANMSHEIRTPLNGIIGFSSLLEAELSRLEDQELYEYANGIQQSGERLLHLLNNIIDISRIEANDLEISLLPCNIPFIVSQISELYNFKANDKGVRLNIQTLETPNAIADERNLSRVITDLIDNAVKYTERGFINVSSGFEPEHQRVFIRIKDTGIGIDSAYLPNIFEAFRQESLGYSRAYQGAGLGLPLAKRLVNLMKGEITVESIKGIGTTVSIYLPAELVISTRESFVEMKETGIEETIQTRDIHVFTVEDDRMNRLVLKSMLQGKYNITMAVDGEETMRILEEAFYRGEIFDIMLFDINLPMPWDGINLMYAVKDKWKEYKKIPFVAQTAYAMTGDRERLLEAGFDDYIAKPINQNRLVTIINKNLRKFNKS
jgi:signal transduction histidine kinase/ActR/RegA family two-component response regulator